MAKEPVPGNVLAVLEHQGLRYELADAGREEAVFVTCLDSGGALCWRRYLQAYNLVVMAGNLRIEGGQLTAVACGGQCKSGDYAYTFMLSLGGELLSKTDKLGS